MNKIISLLKTDLNITFGLSSLAYSFKAKKNRWQSLIYLIAMFSLLPTYYFMVMGLGKIYNSYEQMGQKSYFLLTGFLMSQILVFLFGLLYTMSKYYFSNDLEHLLPLPIKPSYILTSKFLTMMVSEYITSLPIIMPFLIIYGFKNGEGIIYWLYSIIAIILLPVVPLVLSSICVMLFMKYTNIKGKKDLLRVIGAMIFLVAVLYFQLLFQKITQKALVQGEDFFLNLVRDSNILVKKMGMVFPPSMWAALALSNSTNLLGLSNLLLYAITAIILFILMIILSEKLFLGGLIGNMEVSNTKKKSKSKGIELTTKISRPFVAIALKEVKMLFKTPIYLMNSIGGVIIVPVLLVITVITGEESMGPIIQMIESLPYLIPLIGIGFLGALGMLNSVGATTFSREGKNLWIQRTLPIKVEDQIFGRVLASLIIQVLGFVAIIGSLSFIVTLTLLDVLLIGVLGLLASIPMTQLGMIIDIIRPLLTWTNPQQAMKQNLNVLISMGLASLYGGLIFLLVKFMLPKVGINYIYMILATIFIVSSYGFFIALKKLISRQFIELE